MLPLHARVMHFFDSCEDKIHACRVDNLCVSVKFFRETRNHKKRSHLNGTTRKPGRGIPESALQEEASNPRMQEKVRVTVHAAKLVGDPGLPSLLIASAFDTKQVNFLTMATEIMFWEQKKRQAFDKSRKQMTTMKFLRLSVNDEHNFGVGGTHVADQLRDSCHFDHWLCNYEWWLLTFRWDF